MKTTLFAYFTFLICNTLQSQSSLDFCEQLTALQKIVETSHYKPKPLNDSLSKGVFELFLSRMDDNKTIFTDSDD